MPERSEASSTGPESNGLPFDNESTHLDNMNAPGLAELTEIFQAVQASAQEIKTGGSGRPVYVPSYDQWYRFDTNGTPSLVAFTKATETQGQVREILDHEADGRLVYQYHSNNDSAREVVVVIYSDEIQVNAGTLFDTVSMPWDSEGNKVKRERPNYPLSQDSEEARRISAFIAGRLGAGTGTTS
ncbi:MAG TPA: hypothetical protein VMS08_03725 [Candidatus Saccharimonadia bacterium]|nr:hypothetical protein [Candidatus Saccharimonadia bacterium]